MKNSLKSIVIILVTTVTYIITYWILRKGLELFPNLYLWKNIEISFYLYNLKVTLMDIVYFVFGLIVINHGMVNLMLITKENHTVQDMKTRKTKRLLTTGFYSKVRHPMYGTFIIISLATFLPTRSLLGVVIVLLAFVMQIINSVIEEKRVLIKRFGKEYTEYMNKVKNRLFTPVFHIYICFAALITVFGIISNYVNIYE